MRKLLYIIPVALVVAAALIVCVTTGEAETVYDGEVDRSVEVEHVLKPQLELKPKPIGAEESLDSSMQCPVTDEEIIMLAKTMYAESQVVYWNNDKWGVSYTARQAAVGWIALNRYDSGRFGDTLSEILSKPAQFAYSSDTVATEHMLWLASDIVERWWAEQQGKTDVGRTIPADYLFFSGDGRENYFRKEYENTGAVWDWSLPDPYCEGACNG